MIDFPTKEEIDNFNKLEDIDAKTLEFSRLAFKYLYLPIIHERQIKGTKWRIEK